MNAKIVFKNRQGYVVTTDGREFELDSLVRHLQREITIEEGILFRDIWSYIEDESEILGKIFNSAMGEHPIADFIEESHKPYTSLNEDPDDSMHGLEFFWWTEYEKNYNDESRREITISPSFHGYGRVTDKHVNNGKPFDSNYSVSFSSLNKLMDYPIRIDEEIYLSNIWTRTTGKRRVLIRGDIEWTVYDILRAIFYEITWYGSPENRDKSMDELNDIHNKAMKDLGEGNLKRMSLDEVRKNLHHDD